MKWVLVSWNEVQWEVWETPMWVEYPKEPTLFREISRSNDRDELEALAKLMAASMGES